MSSYRISPMSSDNNLPYLSSIVKGGSKITNVWDLSSEKVPPNMCKMHEFRSCTYTRYRLFAVNSYILLYPIILLADSEGPHTA